MRYRIIAGIMAVSLVLAILAFIVYGISTDGPRYLRLYEAHGVYEQTGVSPEDLDLLTWDIVHYFSGQRPSLDREVVVDGVLRPAFGERELTHMADVRGLIQLADLLRIIPLLVFAIGGFVLGKAKKYLYVTKGIFRVSITLLGLMALLGLWAAVDFESLFILFHHLSFRNDLWLLDPRTDLLIRMMPLGFFVDMAKVVAGYAGTALVLLSITSGYGLWKERRKT